MGDDCRRVIHVAVGVISDSAGRVLISRRADHTHQGGLWEFPGGKVEMGETLSQALERELLEELGINVSRSEPLIRITHHYRERCVLLDVHRILAWTGTPTGQEAQPLRWVAPKEMNWREFPAADRPIITALRLPECYLITGNDPTRPAEFLRRLEHALEQGNRLVQLRAPGLGGQEYERLAARVLERCRAWNARLMTNAPLDLALRLESDGIHLTSRQLRSLAERPVADYRLLGASCHSAEELLIAESLGVDFVVLSPVLATRSHPDAIPLGWHRFQQLVETVSLPVFALGGMRRENLDRARREGAQGIAGISGFWSE